MFFIVFVSVWLRFIPGNLSHIRRIERWASSTVDVWLTDIAVITMECMILVFMARPSVNQPEQFFWALLSLLLIDVGWLAAMLYGTRKGTRPEPQWIWMWLNIPSIAVLVVFLIGNKTYPEYLALTGNYGIFVISITFVICAAIDIYKSSPDWFGRPRQCPVPKEENATYQKRMKEAIEEAEKSITEGGIPIGAVLVENGNVIGRGHNQRVQNEDPTAHAEIECLRNAGRRKDYRGTVLFSTLMPCCLCAGAIVQFGIEKVVVGECRNFKGARSFLDDHGVKIINLDVDECYDMLRKYIKTHPSIWKEDIAQK
jgi:cytosine deaminase